MKITFSRLFLVFLCGLGISALAILAAPLIVTAQAGLSPSTTTNHQQAYSELKTAKDAGANVTLLTARFNTALELLDRASDENGTSASGLVSQANSIPASIPNDAQWLTSGAASQQLEATLARELTAPVGALSITGLSTPQPLLQVPVSAGRLSSISLHPDHLWW